MGLSIQQLLGVSSPEPSPPQAACPQAPCHPSAPSTSQTANRDRSNNDTNIDVNTRSTLPTRAHSEDAMLHAVTTGVDSRPTGTSAPPIDEAGPSGRPARQRRAVKPLRDSEAVTDSVAPVIDASTAVEHGVTLLTSDLGDDKDDTDDEDAVGGGRGDVSSGESGEEDWAKDEVDDEGTLEEEEKQAAASGDTQVCIRYRNCVLY